MLNIRGLRRKNITFHLLFLSVMVNTASVSIVFEHNLYMISRSKHIFPFCSDSYHSVYKKTKMKIKTVHSFKFYSFIYKTVLFCFCFFVFCFCFCFLLCFFFFFCPRKICKIYNVSLVLKNAGFWQCLTSLKIKTLMGAMLSTACCMDFIKTVMQHRRKYLCCVPTQMQCWCKYQL